MDGGHRFGVTGEYFKRTADFDNMFEQGAGTSYLYGENSVRKETERQRVSLDYSYRAPSDGGLLDTVTAALYWQRVSLDTVRRRCAAWIRRPSSFPAIRSAMAFPAARMAATTTSARPCTA